MVAGVCGGIAKMVGVDTPIIRILLVAATLLGFGAGAIGVPGRVDGRARGVIGLRSMS